MKTRLLRLCVAAIAAVGFLALAPRASADTLNLTLTDGGPAVTYNPYGGPTVSQGGGPFHWTQNQPLNAKYASPLTTYCIDLDHYISQGSSYTYYTDTELKNAPTIGGIAHTDPTNKVGAITELFDHYYNSSLANAASQAAFQLALWELVYDGGTSKSLAYGRIRDDVTSGDGLAAKALLDSLGKPYTNHDLANAHLEVLLSKSGNQDQITVVQNPKGVPAPPAVMLAGIGVLALFGRGRWTRRPTTTA